MKKGFTLIEILIATTIFVMIMIMTMATIAWASTYQGKLSEIRKVNQSSRKIASSLSDDIRMANGKAWLGFSSNSVEAGEITIINCLEVNNIGNQNFIDTCSFVDEAKKNPVGVNGSNSIFILQENKLKAIMYSSVCNSDDNCLVRRQEWDLDPWPNDVIWIDGPKPIGYRDRDSWVNDPVISAKLLIGGYCPEKHSTDVGNQLTRTQQPFIKFEMIVRSLDYDNIKTTMRAMLEIKSLVETRDYN